MTLKHGYIQVYTGDGKGKTTAAIGLALRAAGAGMTVFIAQFIKSGEYSEIKALARYNDLITVRQFGLGRFIKGAPSEDDIAIAREGIGAIRKAFSSGGYQIVIMEEANVAVTCGLFPVEELLLLMKEKPAHLELVITGRGAVPQVIARADLVTEMRAVKHYYQAGVGARVGIEK